MTTGSKITQKLSMADQRDILMFFLNGNNMAGIRSRFPFTGSQSDLESVDAIDAFNARREDYYQSLEAEFGRICNIRGGKHAWKTV